VTLCGIPAFGFPIPRSDSSQNFIAPEASGDEREPFAEDIFELGAFAHQLFARTPLPRAAAQAKHDSYINNDYPARLNAREDLPERTRRVLPAMLSWNPGARPDIGKVGAALRGKTGLFGQIVSFISGLKSVTSASLSSVFPRLSIRGAFVILSGVAFCAFLSFLHSKTQDISSISLAKLAEKKIVNPGSPKDDSFFTSSNFGESSESGGSDAGPEPAFPTGDTGSIHDRPAEQRPTPPSSEAHVPPQPVRSTCPSIPLIQWFQVSELAMSFEELGLCEEQ
jgi:hypothetical protein